MKEPAITGIVITYNDEDHLEECLLALKFCDELIVVDLGSTDNSLPIAHSMGAKIIMHKWVPVVEMARQFAVEQASNDWIIFMDPDMIFPFHKQKEIKNLIKENDLLAKIYIPYRNYFLTHPVYHGVWGKDKKFPSVIHKNRVYYIPLVHTESTTDPKWESVTLSVGKDEFIRHYWIDSWPQFFEKHRRYIKQEGESQYKKGCRFSWRKCILYTLFESYNNFIRKQGYKDGLLGVILGILWTWYNWSTWQSLRRYQKILAST